MRNFLTAIRLSRVWPDSPSCAIQHCRTNRKPAQRPLRATDHHDCYYPAPQPVQAIFETTMGNITCTLFPDKAPITVDNFIGLATGTKDWKNPSSGATMHNKPLYDGTVFHRVIPNFMIQGGDPLGNGTGGPGYSFRDEIQRSHLSTSPDAWPWPTAGPILTAPSFSSPKFLRRT